MCNNWSNFLILSLPIKSHCKYKAWPEDFINISPNIQRQGNIYYFYCNWTAETNKNTSHLIERQENKCYDMILLWDLVSTSTTLSLLVSVVEGLVLPSPLSSIINAQHTPPSRCKAWSSSSFHMHTALEPCCSDETAVWTRVPNGAVECNVAW